MRRITIIKFSFIIPTLNEEKYLEGCLQSIKRQSLKNWEIIVVDSHSSDNTVKIAKRYTKNILFGKGRPSTARNAGGSKAVGNVLIFCDADVRFSNNFLENIEDIFERGIGGAVFNLKGYDCTKHIERLGYLGVNNIVRFLNSVGIGITAGSCIACRRDIFKMVGGFNSAFISNEDHDLAKKIKRIRRFEFFNDVVVMTSSRRLKKLGFLPITKMYFKSTMIFLFKNGYIRDYWE